MQPHKIGGPNTILQLNETYVVKRKYNRGRLVRASSLAGGIIQDMKEIFVEITSKRDPATLDDIVKRHVLRGTIIHTYNWKGYGNINNLCFVHKAVNHSLNFVESNTGVHTQAIGVWSHIKHAIKKERPQGSFVGRRLPRGRTEMEK